ncbi:MAG: helix-turn-helix domain-containing protein [Armatimonadota bacterium]
MRLDKGLSQLETAAIIGVRECSIWNWENNRNYPVLKFIPRIIEFLGYSPFGDVSDLSIGEKIIIYRRSLGIIQEDLAKQWGVDPTTLARWEKGRTAPPERVIEMLDGFLETWGTAR